MVIRGLSSAAYEIPTVANYSSFAEIEEAREPLLQQRCDAAGSNYFNTLY